MPLTTPKTPAETSDEVQVGARAIIVALCFGGLSASLMQTLVLPIQGELPRLLTTSASSASWVVTVTLLAGAVAMPVAGRLGDIYGKQRVLAVSAGILALGSMVSALSDSLAPMLVGRALQGLAMGYIPVAISLVREVVPPRLVGTSIAAISATLGVGGAIGLPLSAWIAADYDWHWLFWISFVLALLVLAVTVWVVPHVTDAYPARLDVVGAAGLAAGLSAVLVGVSKGNDWGWTDPLTLGTLSAGLVLLLVWGVHQVRRDDPLVDLRVSARRPVLLTNVTAVLMGFGMMASGIVLPQLLILPAATGYGMGQTLLEAGLWLAPGGLTMMAMAPLSSRLLSTVGARSTLILAAVVMGLGYLVALFLMDAAWQLMIANMLSAAGVGIGYAAMPTLILDNVPAQEAGSGVGVNGLMRSVGTTSAGAVMAALLTSRTVALATGEAPGPEAFRMCFLVGAAAAFAAAALAASIPRREVG